MDRSVLATKQLVELKSIAADLQLRGYQRLRKADLIDRILAATNGADIPRVDPTLDLGGTAEAPAGERPAPTNGERRAARTRARTLEAPDNGHHVAPELLDTDMHHADQRAEEEAEPKAESRIEPVRTRVRTRTRDRGAVEDAAGTHAPIDTESSAGAGDRPAAEPLAESPSSGGDLRARPSEGAEPAGSGGEVTRDERREAGDGQRRPREELELRAAPVTAPEEEEEDGSRRRRRSRRERRRNKGGQQGPGGGPATQVVAHPRAGRHADEDSSSEPGEVRAGVLDVLPEGYGFLRTSGYLPGDRDVYVSQGQIRKHGLRRGDVVEGPIRAQRSNEKVPALHHVDTVNGLRPDDNGSLPHRPEFKDMTPLFPDERLRLETPDGPISMRIMDLMSPIGKGQRGLIVSPPKAGKTTILKELGQAIAYNNPECHLMVVLVDERPEEVTDMQRSIPGEVIASTFDRPADDHTQIAELAMERAKRLVEQGRDVVVLLDSITRLARAYNLSAPASGRIMSGGVDSTALYPPKRFFGAARNIERGGSLTIVASALIETGSKMDEVIFEEFKGTGNMEIRLDRRLEQKRIFPAIDIEASGTRKEELLLDKDELTIIWKLRRVLHALEGPAALELLIDKIRSTRSNNQFLVQIQKSNLQA